jgi:diguanylate cyclase (GGDEF)-like protein
MHPSLTSEYELHRYVGSVTLACLALALAVDVVNQLIFFVDLSTCLRSWAITTVLALALALPISRSIGRAHLELYRAKRVAEALARTDQLTGLFNRRALMDAAPTFGHSVFALVIADIDRFKLVNDTYGHVVGDDVIRTVARRMANELSGVGVLARVGGEEFALLCSGLSADDLMERLNALRDRIASTPIISTGLAVRVTISAGIAVAQSSEGFDQLYSAADHALYSAKAAERNRITLAKGATVAFTNVADHKAPSDFDTASATASPKLFVAT